MAKPDAPDELTADLSLPAETLLFAINPSDGGLLIKRHRLRDAVRAAGRVEGRRYSLRQAHRELRDAGLIDAGRLANVGLTDRVPPGRRFNTIKRSSASGEFATERDQQLFVLLAGSGVLASRMNRDERRRARRRLGALMPDPNPSSATSAPGLVALAVLADHGFGEFAGEGSDYGPDSVGPGSEGGVDVSKVGFGDDGGGTP